ncbi:TolC family protein [Larkinella soli]|uniref:TolC family protein n=1 Tax=Larkinella soli TaxID=1770527 RepID=UPI000FFC155E|nr:TolC family protein [Larkinella soli]
MKRILSSILFITTVGSAVAQSVPNDLRNLINQANSYFPRLKEQEKQLQAGQVRVEIARSAYQPNVSGTAAYQYVNPVAKATFPLNGRDTQIQFQPNHNLNANLGIGQTIYDFGRTEAGIRRAADDVQLLKHNLDLTRQNLGYQVAAAYYGIGFLQKSISVQDSVIRVAEENIQVIVNRLRNGDALEFDILTQRVRLETAKNRKIDLLNNLERQRALLSYLTGHPNPVVSPAAVQFDVPAAPFTLEQSLQSAQSGNREVLLAQDRVRAAQTDILVTNRAGLPNISFSGAAGYRNGYLPDIAALKFNVAAGVNLSVPIYSGKRNKLQNQAARLNLDASRFAVENAGAQLRQSLEQLSADIRSNQQRLQNLETQVLQAHKALDIARNRLKAGVITNVELQSAETGVEEAELARLNYQYQLVLNQLEYKRLLGGDL